MLSLKMFKWKSKWQLTFNDEVISVSTENLDQDISEIVETKRISIETLNDILDDNEEEEVHRNELKEKS